jgi:starch synthase
MRIMKVLQVCAELYPLLKTGGLADATAAISSALATLGADVRVLLPAFPPIVQGLDMTGAEVIELSKDKWPRSSAAPAPLRHGLGPIAGGAVTAGQARLLRLRPQPDGLQVYLLDAPEWFNRPGNPYLGVQGQEWHDNAQRFGMLGWAGACLAAGLDPKWQPDVVHAHDWHAALTPAYARALRDQGVPVAPLVFTVHNLAYQGVFDAHLGSGLGLPGWMLGFEGMEYWGRMSFMKAALLWSERITTVSPTYCREIQGGEQGAGLDGLLRTRTADLSGILNGVDYEVWSPSHDPLLDSPPYDMEQIEGKAQAKTALQNAMGLEPRDNALLIGVVSRLTEQKGLHLLLPVMEGVIHRGGQLALLGTGDATLERRFQELAIQRPGQVAVQIGYNEPAAHRIVAGASVMLLPSAFEPCGLTQLYAMRYGTVPVVRAVGGLADTVVDVNAHTLSSGQATGFSFGPLTAHALWLTLERALDVHEHHPDHWRMLQQNGMALRFDWSVAARSYWALYTGLQ